MTFSHLDDGVPGGGSPLHPEWFRAMYRVTEVVGGAGPLQADGELRMETLDEPAKLLWMWWAPGGDTSVTDVPAVATEPWQEGPPTVL